MWVDITSFRFADVQPMLEFPNPDAEKQRKLKASGIVKWARFIPPTVSMFVRRSDPQWVSVPMGAAWMTEEGYRPREGMLEAVEPVEWLRPHQKAALVDTLAWRSGIVVAPCGAGKTQMGLAMAHWRRKDEPTSLIVVHTRDLAKQWHDRFQQVLAIKPFMACGSFEFEQAYALAAKGVGPGVIITTFQTLAKVQDGITGLNACRFGVVVVDEAHHAPAKMFQDVLAGIKCHRVYGLTATPQREDGWTPAMLAWLGPIRHRVDPRELQSMGITVSPTVVRVDTPYHSWSGDFTTIVNDLLQMEDRNELIRKMVERHGDGPQLVLTSRVEHAIELAKRIPHAEALVGQTRDRDAVLKRVTSGEVKVLVATQLADEGLDLPALCAVHLVAPSRAAGRVIQRIGRVMRSAPGKSRPTVYDYVDEMTLLISQWRSRAKACRESLPGVRFETIRQGELP